MTIRITGMNSGLDTEKIISELVSAQSAKVNSLKKQQISLSYKQDVWKALNTKVYSMYTGSLDTLKYEASYAKKTTDVSDSTVASVTTSDSAMYGTQKLKVTSLATAGYITGGTVSRSDKTSTDAIDSTTKLTDLGVTAGASFTVKVGSGTDAKSTSISIDSSTTVNSLITSLKSAGISANYDTTNKRFYLASSDTGTKNDFTLTGSDDTGTSALTALGLNTAGGANIITATDAKINLNGVDYTSSSNTFTVNGLSIKALKTTGSEDSDAVSITTSKDTSGIYDMIKKFINTYSSIINEMDSDYNTENSGYSPLLSSEKESMSDTEVADWEKKVKSAVLYRDSTLSTVSQAMKDIMSEGYTVNGKTSYLSSFGIETLDYFTAADNEKNAYHIDGDSDDSTVSTQTNKLKYAIESDPDSVTSFFTQLSQKLYSKLGDLMQSSTLSSAFTLYDDKQMASDYVDYTERIADQEEKVTDMEDTWYSKFSTMETALTKINAKSSSISSMLS